MRWRCLGVLPTLSAALLWAQTPAPGRVELTVVDSLNAPVPGATVEVTRTGGSEPSSRHATTDSRGFAVFPRVDPGRYRVTAVQVTGYLYDFQNRRDTFEVAEGATAITGNVVVVRLGAIEGTVVYDTGEPAAGVHVTVLKYSWLRGVKSLTGAVSSSATTDSHGRYRIGLLNPGGYYVRVTGGTPPFAPVYYPNTDTAATAVAVVVSPGPVTSSAAFRIKRSETFHMRGRVFGIPEGTTGGVLTIQSCTDGVREFPGFLTALPVRSGGSFDAMGIPPGRYCVIFRGNVKAAATAYAQDVVAVTDRDVDNLRLSATAQFELPGSVKPPEEKSAPIKASVQLMPVTFGELPLTVPVDSATGAFHFANVLPTESDSS